MNAPQLKLVVNQETGELDDDSVAIPSDKALLVEQIVELRAKLAAEIRKNKPKVVDAVAADAMDVLAHWKTVVMKDHPNVKIKMFGARWKVVNARLAEGWTAAELKTVADVASRFPYERYGERFCEPGQGRTKRDDATFIYHDEVRVQRLLEMKQRENTHQFYREWLHRACERYSATVVVLAMLGDREPHAEVLLEAIKWARTQVGPWTEEGRQ